MSVQNLNVTNINIAAPTNAVNNDVNIQSRTNSGASQISQTTTLDSRMVNPKAQQEHTEISKIEGMEWVSHLYNIGNSFIHFEKSHFLSSMKITSEDDRTILMSIGYHDSFIPDNDKIELVNWMNLTIDKIVEQTQIWFLEKCEALNFDIEKLNEL